MITLRLTRRQTVWPWCLGDQVQVSLSQEESRCLGPEGVASCREAGGSCHTVTEGRVVLGLSTNLHVEGLHTSPSLYTPRLGLVRAGYNYYCAGYYYMSAAWVLVGAAWLGWGWRTLGHMQELEVRRHWHCAALYCTILYGTVQLLYCTALNCTVGGVLESRHN